MASESRLRRRSLATWLAALTLVSSGIAGAKPTPAERETARGLMNEGDRHFLDKDYGGALASYQGANAVMGVPTTGMAVARSLAALGQLVEARDAAVLVTRMPVQPGEPAPFVRAREAAERLTKELASRIPSVQIIVSGLRGDAGVRVTLDGESIPAGLLTLPRKTDPGAHSLRASSSGFADASRDITLHEGENASVVLTLKALPQEAPVETVATTTPADASVPAPPHNTRLSPLVYVGFGVGGAGLVVGAVTGILHLNKVGSIKTEYCNGGTACSAGYQSALDGVRPTAIAADIGFGVALAGIGVGVTGLLLSRGGASVPPRDTGISATLTPVVGVNYVGLDGRF